MRKTLKIRHYRAYLVWVPDACILVFSLFMCISLLSDIEFDARFNGAATESKLVPISLQGTYRTRGRLVGNILQLHSSGEYVARHYSCTQGFVELGTLINLDDQHWATVPTRAWDRHRRAYETNSRVLIMVEWGRRRYIIPQNHMGYFVDDINRGLEPSFGKIWCAFLIKDNAHDAIFGMPNLPMEYMGSIRSDPLVESINSVDVHEVHFPDDKHNKEYVGVLRMSNRTQGACEGLSFVIRNTHDLVIGHAVITRINDESCEATFNSLRDKPCEGMDVISWSTWPRR